MKTIREDILIAIICALGAYAAAQWGMRQAPVCLKATGPDSVERLTCAGVGR